MHEKILVCGSREYSDYEKLKEVLDSITLWYERDEISIISGGAEGADSLAKEYCKNRNLQIEEVLPDWEKYGRKAGYIRNKQMIEMNPYMVIAFWDGKSSGTKITIDLATQKKIPTLIIWF